MGKPLRTYKLPCRGCFLECEPYESHVGGKPGRRFPCSGELYLWARAHRSDPPGLIVSKWEGTK